MPIGAYHYSYATTLQEAIKEAEFFINRLKWTQWEYPVFFDFEDKCQAKLNNLQKTDVILNIFTKTSRSWLLYWILYIFKLAKKLPGYEPTWWISIMDCTLE